jgi:cystathionine beta-lyase
VELPNVFGIVALIAGYNQGEEWLDQVMEYIEENFKFLKDFINQNLPNVEFIDPEGTYLAWLNCRKMEMDDKKLNEFILKEAKVALYGGNIFGPGGEGFQRINVACPRSLLEECMKKILLAIKEKSK